MKKIPLFHFTRFVFVVWIINKKKGCVCGDGGSPPRLYELKKVSSELTHFGHLI